MLDKRKWSMPHRNTFAIKPIRELLQQYCTSGLWLDPFANNSIIRRICPKPTWQTNDLNPDCQADHHFDALEFLSSYSEIDGVVYDPPYSVRQVSECYKGIGRKVTQQTTQARFWSQHKDQIARCVKPNGLVICFGWNSNGIGKTRGFEMIDLLLVPHGGAHNDTIVTVERKVI